MQNYEQSLTGGAMELPPWINGDAIMRLSSEELKRECQSWERQKRDGASARSPWGAVINRTARKDAEPDPQPKPQPTTEQKPALAFNLYQWTVAERFEGDAPEIEWLVDGSIERGIAGMVAASGDTGKSYALLELCRRVAFGCSPLAPPIFGGHVKREGTAVFITAEDSAAAVHRRLAALDPKGARHSEAGERLMVVPLPDAGGPVSFWRLDRGGVTITEQMQALAEQLYEIDDLELVVLDPLASFAAAPINEDPAAGQFVCATLAQLAANTGATILTAHHMRKATKPIESLGDARDAIRGTSALVDGLRMAYALWPTADEMARKVCKEIGEPYEPHKIVSGGIVKTNSPVRRVMATYVRNEAGLLVDRTANLRAAAPAQGDLMAALTVAVEAAAKAGQPFTKTGATGLYEQRTRLPAELQGLGKHKMTELADATIKRGDIVLTVAKGSPAAKWLDVPGGPFAIGLGEFRPGAARS